MEFRGVGPHKDLIGGWAAAARKNGLRFAVSVHCAYAWTFYETSQGADKDGPFAGIPYDGKLTKADGQGQWWDGLDPQDLYAQNHAVGQALKWDPALGTNTPDVAYIQKFFKRTQQLWDDYHPDQIYFDDDILPFYKVDDEIGLKLAAHFYNSSIKLHGRNEAVINGKHLNDSSAKHCSLTWSAARRIEFCRNLGRRTPAWATGITTARSFNTTATKPRRR